MLAGLGAAALVGSFVYAPWAESGPIFCPSRLLFGLPCPGCGLTRSFCAVSHGDLAHAFGFHLLGPLLYLGLIFLVPALTFQAVTNRAVPIVNRLLFSKRASYALAAILCTYHAVRVVAMIASGELWGGMQHSLSARMLIACAQLFG